MKSKVQSIYISERVCSTEKENFLNFFGLFFIRFVSANSLVISNKTPWSIWSSKQRRLAVLINIFSRSHVSYCPFVWMWYGRILHNRIFRLHFQEDTFIISMFARWRQIGFTMAIWKFHQLNNMRTLKASPQIYLLIFASRGPL